MGYIGRQSTIRLIIHLMKKSKKKQRWIWNVFWSAVLAFIMFLYAYSTIYLLGGMFIYHTEQKYVRYFNGSLYTDMGVFEIERKPDLVDVDISTFIEVAKIGDNLQLTISKVTGNLMEIQIDGNVLYKIPTVPIAIWIQQPLFLILIACGIFMLLGINLKHPKGVLKKMQQDLNWD